MKWFILTILTACASSTTVPKKVTTFSCVEQNVCVLNEDGRLIAVNSSDKTVAVELRLNHIKNIELSYRYPFVEFLEPHSSRVLLTFRRKKMTKPYAFDYDWNWRNTEN